MDEPVTAGSPDRLRSEATDHAGAERWTALLELEDALRGDGDYWTLIPHGSGDRARRHRGMDRRPWQVGPARRAERRHLAAISTGVTDQQGPALVFRADHPYVSVTDSDGAAGFLEPGEPLRLARDAGEHRLTVSITTPYGTLAPQLLHYRAR